MSTIVDAAPMRVSRSRTCLGNGQWSEWHEGIDLRGTPIGDKVEVWEWDRLVYPGRRQQGRRVREYIKVMHCPEGWYSTSGIADEPHGGEICGTLLEPKWAGRDFPRGFNAYHDEHPVVWVIKVKRHTRARTLRYCDPELPDEYRPVTDAEAPTAS